MAKLELSFLIGADSKKFLSELTDVVDRLEALQSKLTTKKKALESEDVETVTEDDDFEEKPSKKANGKINHAEDFDDEETEDETETTTVEDDEDEDFTEPAPKKAKVKKLTDSDINTLCKQRAARTGGKQGRQEVLAILKKKFKVSSVTELKEAQYAAVAEALQA